MLRLLWHLPSSKTKTQIGRKLDPDAQVFGGRDVDITEFDGEHDALKHMYEIGSPEKMLCSGN